MVMESSADRIIQAAGQAGDIRRTAEMMERSLHRTAVVCAALVVLVGILVLLGWLVGNEFLMSVLPGHIRMKANAAVCFIAAGLALAASLQSSLSAKRLARVLAPIVLCVGAATLAEYVFKIDLRIDEFLFRDPVQRIFPGRMAEITAACFCLVGLSVLLLGRERLARMLSQWVALSVCALAFVAIVGWVYGVRILYGSAGYTSMALHTGVGFLILGVGLLLAQPDLPIVRVLFAPEAGGWLARRILPVTMLLPVVLGWAYLSPALDFGGPRFGMALFAVTAGATGSAGLWFVAMFLNRRQRDQTEFTRVREEGAAAVRQSERELRLVTDHLPTLLSYIDTQGRFVRVNRTYET
jgi:PAS domain-containing protein